MASCLASLALCAILAQTGQPARGVDHETLERIRAALRAPKLTITVIEDGAVRYRVFVEERWLRLNIPWDGSKDVAVPSYVRPSYLEPHYEFLRMATPEAYHASTLYPGADLLGPTGGLVKAIKRAAREREAAAIRRQIQEELRQIAAANGQARD